MKKKKHPRRQLVAVAVVADDLFFFYFWIFKFFSATTTTKKKSCLFDSVCDEWLPPWKFCFWLKNLNSSFVVLKNIPVFGFCVCVCMCGCAIFKTIFNVYPFIVVEKSEFFLSSNRFNILLYVFLVCLMSISNFTQSPLFFRVYRPKKKICTIIDFSNE